VSDYFIEKESYGRVERVMDVQKFAADLAKALGGTYVAPKPNDMGAGERYAHIIVDDCDIGITRGWENRNSDKVTFNIAPANCTLGYNDTPRGEEYKLPRASMSVSKPMNRLVADVKRRVIDPAKAPIAKRREHAAELKRRANSLVDVAAKLRAAHPGLEVKVADGSTYSGSIYRNGDGPYVSGSVYADGTVSIDRMGTLSPAQFDRVMRALFND